MSIIGVILALIAAYRLFRYIRSRSWTATTAHLSDHRWVDDRKPNDEGELTGYEGWEQTYSYKAADGSAHSFKRRESHYSGRGSDDEDYDKSQREPKTRRQIAIRYNPNRSEQWMEDSQRSIYWTIAFTVSGLILFIADLIN